MQRNQLKNSVGKRVRLSPPVKYRRQSPGFRANRDELWVIERDDDTGLRILNIATRHSHVLGYDHVHNYKSDPAASSEDSEHGVLTLHVQLFVDGVNLRWEPTKQPGVEVPWPADIEADLKVALGYKVRMQTAERHEYALRVFVVNSSMSILNDYALCVRLPRAVTPDAKRDKYFDASRSDKKVNAFTLNSVEGSHRVLQGDRILLMTITYVMDEQLFLKQDGLFEMPVTATLYPTIGNPIETIKPFGEMQQF